jgi:hypothetical protein
MRFSGRGQFSASASTNPDSSYLAAMKNNLTTILLPGGWAWRSAALAIILVHALVGSASAQGLIRGTVADERGEGLPFVHIIVNEQPSRVFTSDIDGSFSLPYAPDIRGLTFSYVGFAAQRIDISGLPAAPLRVILSPAPYTLQEAVVVAGENPAHRIIRLVLENRKRHDPEQLPGFEYRAFTKLTLRLMPNEEERRRQSKPPRKIFEEETNAEKEAREPSRIDSVHLFLMETLSRHAYQRPQKRRDEILRHRSSGFEEPWFVGIATQLQPFSFYQDELPFLEKRYLNPISPGSTKRYRFRLEETFYDAADSIFVISFRPMPNTAFTGLQGVLYIHSAGYAIQHLIAESAEEEQIHFHIDQKYARVEGGQWFPAQLSLIVEAAKYPSPELGIRLNARTWIDSVQLMTEFPRAYFAGRESYRTAPDINRRDSLLDLARRETLTWTDSLSYVFWDSLGQALSLDKKMRLLEVAAEGALPIGKIDWVFADLLRFSQFEGTVPGLGLRSGRRLSSAVELYGYGGYAIAARQWQYAGQFSLFPRPADRQLRLGVRYARGLVEPAIFEQGQYQLINRRFFAQRMDLQESLEAFFTAQPWRAVQLRAALRRQQHQPLFEYVFRPADEGQPQTEFTFAEAELYVRYAHRLQSYRFLGAETELQSDRPIVHLRLAKGWEGWWGGEHDYLRLESALQYSLRHRRWGVTRFVAEAGWCSPQVPYTKLFTPVGTGAGWDAVSLFAAFETMQPYEFVADRSLHLYVEHTFGRLTRKSPFFQPQPALIHRLGWGHLSQPELHGPEAWRAMEQGYWESGLALHSLLRINYLNIGYISLGVKALYRYGPYQMPDFSDNLAVRLTLNYQR